MALVLLLAKYDPILSQCVSKSVKTSQKQKISNPNSKGRGSSITYLSKTTINKLVNICENRVKLAISYQVKEA